ncbi:MAG: L,D-transpeptidase [Planctomycetaceae bacterium]
MPPPVSGGGGAGRLRWGGIVVLASLVVSGTRAAVAEAADASSQLVLVVVADWRQTTGTLNRYDRGAVGWTRAGSSMPVTIGRAGCAWGSGLHPAIDEAPRKREGDGRSPAGVFAIGTAFGSATTLDTGLAYRPLTAHDWCIDDSRSPHYNRIVDDREVGAEAVRGSTEPMRRELHLDGDRLYDIGFVIEHNAGCAACAGSCIFAHPWHDAGTPTAGCTALAADDLRELLRWLRADAHPRFVLLPAAEHRRVWQAWNLPSPGDAP